MGKIPEHRRIWFTKRNVRWAYKRKSNNKAFNQNLQNTTALVSRIYGFTKNLSQPKLCEYFDGVAADLPEVDIFSIVDKNSIRLYHISQHCRDHHSRQRSV